MKELKVAYFEGRPYGHHLHSKYSQSIGSQSFHIDYILRYHDIPKSSKIRRYLSYLLTAIIFPTWKYDAVFSEEGYISMALMKFFGKLKNKPLIGLMATHTSYNISKNLYSKKTIKALLYTYNKYDAFICIGDYQFELMSKLLASNKQINLYKVFNGVNQERLEPLNNCNPNLENKLHFIFIGDCTTKERIYIKGLDLAVQVFEKLNNEDPDIKFTIIGNINKESLYSLLPLDITYIIDSIEFVGNSTDLSYYLNLANFYIHPARVESWGISVIEAMLAGLPTLVSNETGAKSVVREVYPNLICQLDISEILFAINNYQLMNLKLKKELVVKGKKLILENYTEEKAVQKFKDCFYQEINSKNLIR